MAGETVLVVDDNEANLKLVQVVLAAEGYDVRAVADGESVLPDVEAVRPGVILMDVQLPGIDGLELTRRLKADPETADIPVIALTAYAMVGDEQKAIDAGCDGYVAKPIDTRALPEVVAGMLDGAGRDQH